MSLWTQAYYPCGLVLHSAHGNEYIDLHIRPKPEVAAGDNISAGNKVKRLKMDPEYRWAREVVKNKRYIIINTPDNSYFKNTHFLG